jgi:hypothetical protein
MIAFLILFILCIPKTLSALTCLYRKLDSAISVVKAAEDGL